MKTVYIKKDKVIKYFIFGISENKENSCENIYFTDIETIESKAFQKWSNVKNIFWDEKLKTIENEAFKDCFGLEVFCCGSYDDEQESAIVNLKVHNSIKKGKNNKIVNDDFAVQACAFSNCESLHTVVFPNCSKLIIEKSAFENCTALRTIVAFSKEISFTENPFEDCPKELTFICEKGSEVERFARENGYGFINA